MIFMAKCDIFSCLLFNVWYDLQAIKNRLRIVSIRQAMTEGIACLPNKIHVINRPPSAVRAPLHRKLDGNSMRVSTEADMCKYS